MQLPNLTVCSLHGLDLFEFFSYVIVFINVNYYYFHYYYHSLLFCTTTLDNSMLIIRYTFCFIYMQNFTFWWLFCLSNSKSNSKWKLLVLKLKKKFKASFIFISCVFLFCVPVYVSSTYLIDVYQASKPHWMPWNWSSTGVSHPVGSGNRTHRAISSTLICEFRREHLENNKGYILIL